MFYYQRFNQYFAQVAGGLEDVAATELKALGATDGEVLTRGIHFKADRETLYRINYRSRLATRVLAPLIKFEAKTPEELYLGAKKVARLAGEPWSAPSGHLRLAVETDL